MVRVITLLGILSLPTWSESGPVSEASAPAIIGTLMPALYNGYLYSVVSGHMVTLFAPNGQCILNLPIEGRGSGRVSVQSVAIDTDGTLAIAWVAEPNAGIDTRDSFGKLVRSIDTGTYLPMHLSFGDHSLWAFGWQRNADREWGIAAKDYQTVRKYSMDGKEIGSYLPRSLFPPGLQPAEGCWQKRGITITSDRVGIEAISGDVGNQREWVELGLNGDLLGRWKLNPNDEGVAFTSDNHVYVHRFDRESKSQGVFRLNREKSTWELVNAPAPERARLYGADGDKLIFAEWSYGVMHLSWYPQP
jgi:hypothetical protein